MLGEVSSSFNGIKSAILNYFNFPWLSLFHKSKSISLALKNCFPWFVAALTESSKINNLISNSTNFLYHKSRTFLPNHKTQDRIALYIHRIQHCTPLVIGLFILIWGNRGNIHAHTVQSSSTLAWNTWGWNMDPTKCGTYHKSTQGHQFLMHGDSPQSQFLDFVGDGTLDFQC